MRVERILAELSGKCGAEADGIIRCFETVIDLNLLFAKATLAYRMKAMAPKVTDDGHILLKKARHPLIDPKKVVPIDSRWAMNTPPSSSPVRTPVVKRLPLKPPVCSR